MWHSVFASLFIRGSFLKQYKPAIFFPSRPPALLFPLPHWKKERMLDSFDLQHPYNEEWTILKHGCFLYRPAFVSLSGAWSLEPCELSRCPGDRCDLLASSRADSWATFTQSGRYGCAWVTDENPWGALDYGEWTVKRNHIGHSDKRSPWFYFRLPSLVSVLSCNECGNRFPSRSVWTYIESRCCPVLPSSVCWLYTLISFVPALYRRE